MFAVWELIFFSLCHAAFAQKPNADPEYLNMLRETGRHEEFAKLLGLEDVSLVHPLEGRTEEELLFTSVSPLGDILLTPEQEEQARQGINFLQYSAHKWENHEIPFVIGRREFSKQQEAQIYSVYENMNNMLRNMKIVPRTNQKDYVQIINGRGCYANMGKVGGQQPLSLESGGCFTNGTIMHEMLHTMGMIHEQSRPDRDEYVDVLYENIPQDWHSQYQKMDAEVFDIFGRYDPYSVLHYPMKAPGGKLAFRFHDPSVNTAYVGQRIGLTKIDKQKAEALYS